MSIVLFSYRIAYTIATGYTPYQLLYGLHPLMLAKYIVLVVGGNERYNTLVRILTSIIIEVEKFQEVQMSLQKLHEFSSGIKHYGVNKKIQKNDLILVITFCGFQRATSHT